MEIERIMKVSERNDKFDTKVQLTQNFQETEK